MPFKFEKLEVWQLSLEYSDVIYDVAERLPRSEDYNLRSQITRAATSVSLNIAEGSTSQTGAEQARFLSMAIRSLIETVACLYHIKRRQYLDDTTALRDAYKRAETLVAKSHTMRKVVSTTQATFNDESENYQTGTITPFDEDPINTM
jgi:four helix bundle protein